MTPHHHLSDDMIESYADGSLSEGWSIAVASHMALCPQCRARLGALEAIGGAVLSTISTPPIEDDAWAAMRARISALPREAAAPVRVEPSAALLPRPLRDYVGSDVEGIRWRSLGRGASQLRLRTGDRETQVRLLRIPAGKPVPEHSHGGRELTLVLSGAFRDGDAVFGRGDIEDADPTLTHQPIATEDADCICLAVTDAPLRFTSWIVRLVQPVLGI